MWAESSQRGSNINWCIMAQNTNGTLFKIWLTAVSKWQTCIKDLLILTQPQLQQHTWIISCHEETLTACLLPLQPIILMTKFGLNRLVGVQISSMSKDTIFQNLNTFHSWHIYKYYHAQKEVHNTRIVHGYLYIINLPMGQLRLLVNSYVCKMCKTMSQMWSLSDVCRRVCQEYKGAFHPALGK